MCIKITLTEDKALSELMIDDNSEVTKKAEYAIKRMDSDYVEQEQ